MNIPKNSEIVDIISRCIESDKAYHHGLHITGEAFKVEDQHIKHKLDKCIIDKIRKAVDEQRDFMVIGKKNKEQLLYEITIHEAEIKE